MHHVWFGVFNILLTFPVRIWDVRPYAPADRQLKLFLGAQHGFEKVSVCAHVCVTCSSHCFKEFTQVCMDTR